MSRLSCVVPAAGFSRRSPSGNKLLQTLPDGRTVLATLVRTLLGSRCCHEIIVVTGHQADAVSAALAGLPVRVVHAANHGEGMGSSLATGLRACAPDAEGFLLCPGDLPWLRADTVATIASAFESDPQRRHVIPTEKGLRGHPVLLAACLRPQLEDLRGESGARELLLTEETAGRVHWLPVQDPGIHRDTDQGLATS